MLGKGSDVAFEQRPVVGKSCPALRAACLDTKWQSSFRGMSYRDAEFDSRSKASAHAGGVIAFNRSCPVKLALNLNGRGKFLMLFRGEKHDVMNDVRQRVGCRAV